MMGATRKGRFVKVLWDNVTLTCGCVVPRYTRLRVIGESHKRTSTRVTVRCESCRIPSYAHKTDVRPK